MTKKRRPTTGPNHKWRGEARALKLLTPEQREVRKRFLEESLRKERELMNIAGSRQTAYAPEVPDSITIPDED